MQDADGFDQYPLGSLTMTSDELSSFGREDLLRECRNKADSNPMISTAVRGIQGRLAGRGFETTFEILIIQEVIEVTEEDPRNRLYHFWPKFLARAFIDGELGIILPLHPDGFVYVDYSDPQSINNSSGTDETGINFHSTKTTPPLFYLIETTIDSQAVRRQIPSYTLDVESLQEKTEGEPSRKKKPKKDNYSGNKAKG